MKKILTGIAFILVIAGISCGQETGLQNGLALKYMVQAPRQKTPHPPVIILLHGYGSDERDLFELRNVFPGNYLVVAARAPFSAGAQGYQWFAPGSDGATKDIIESRKLVLKFISQITSKYDADARQVYVMGFSQGAMMSYEAGLTKPELIKGIAVLSGKIFPAFEREIKNTPALKQLRIFVSHGTADNRIPFAEGKAAAQYLESIGLKPQFHEYAGMGHAINNDVLADLVKWLQ